MKFNIIIGAIEITIYVISLLYALSTAVRRLKKKLSLKHQGLAVQRFYNKNITAFRFMTFVFSFMPCIVVLFAYEYREQDFIGYWVYFTVFVVLMTIQLLLQTKQRGYLYFDHEGVRFINDESRLIRYREIEEACWDDFYTKAFQNTLQLTVNGKKIVIHNITEEDFDKKIAPHIKHYSKKSSDSDSYRQFRISSPDPVQYKYNNAAIFDPKTERMEIEIVFNEAQTEELEKILQKDKWQVAKNLQLLDLAPNIILYDEAGNEASLHEYEGEALIIFRYAEYPKEGEYYLAPVKIIGNVEKFLDTIDRSAA